MLKQLQGDPRARLKKTKKQDDKEEKKEEEPKKNYKTPGRSKLPYPNTQGVESTWLRTTFLGSYTTVHLHKKDAARMYRCMRDFGVAELGKVSDDYTKIVFTRRGRPTPMVAFGASASTLMNEERAYYDRFSKHVHVCVMESIKGAFESVNRDFYAPTSIDAVMMIAIDAIDASNTGP
tara:strand:+ start:88 stop:621 length:534 start_codon:yes stop_codon:yes gene_type:complete